jgi:hypothetical protein
MDMDGRFKILNSFKNPLCAGLGLNQQELA